MSSKHLILLVIVKDSYTTFIVLSGIFVHPLSPLYGVLFLDASLGKDISSSKLFGSAENTSTFPVTSFVTAVFIY